MPIAAQIPGYYYDEQKKKYFKIVKNQHAPAGFKYAAQTVEHRERAEAKVKAKKREDELKRKGLKRAQLAPFQRDGLFREHGLPSVWRPTDRLRGYLDSFDQVRLEFWGNKIAYNYMTPLGQNSSKGVQGGGGFDSRGAFDVSIEHASFYYERYPAITSTSPLLQAPLHTDMSNVFPDHPLNTSRIVALADSRIISVDINPSTEMVLGIWECSATGPNCHMSSLDRNNSFAHSYRLDDGPLAKNSYGLNCVAVAPEGSSCSFAVGGATGVVHGLDQHGNHRVLARNKGKAETIALEFLSKSSDLLLRGFRSGEIAIGDLRAPEVVLSIRHASSVSQIKEVTPETFVVSGLEDTMCIYDIRMARRSTAFGNRPQAQEYASVMTKDIKKVPNYRGTGAASKANRHALFTYPLVSMSQHRNNVDTRLGLAVDKDTGLIAASQREFNENSIPINGLRVFDSKTGACVKQFPPKRNRDDLHGIYTMRWVDDSPKGENRPKSLWFSRDGGYYCMRWENEMECDEVDVVEPWPANDPLWGVGLETRAVRRIV